MLICLGLVGVGERKAGANLALAFCMTFRLQFGNYSCAQYLGIPYASPPIGELRFAPPQPVTNWSTIYQAVDYGNACVQDCDLPPLTCPKTPINEDCLYLNVYTPLPGFTESLPVMMWIHGGHFGKSQLFVSWKGLLNRPTTDWSK